MDELQTFLQQRQQCLHELQYELLQLQEEEEELARNRRNRRSRKSLIPKDALTTLNEMKGINMGEFEVNVNSGGDFTAVITVNGKEFQGNGSSKVDAKNNASEKVLRDFFITNMLEKPSIPTAGNDSNPTCGEQGIEAMDTKDGNSDSAKDDADGMSMTSLASFALFKLFNEWERDGFSVPALHPSPIPNTPSTKPNGAAVNESKKVTCRTELPPNWEAMDPTTLLCKMRPDLTYTECGVVEKNTFKKRVLKGVGVVVDGIDFYGTGLTKEFARKSAAISVCNTLFGTNFPKEEKE